MFNCSECQATFSAKKSLMRHLANHSATKKYICDACGHQFVRLDIFKRHVKELHHSKGISASTMSTTTFTSTAASTAITDTTADAVTTTTTSISASIPAAAAAANGDSIDQGEDKAPAAKKGKFELLNKNFKMCQTCDVRLDANKFTAHLNSLSHKKKSCATIIKDNIRLVSSAFSGRIATYIIENVDKEELSPLAFLTSTTNCITDLLEEELRKHSSIKFNVELFGLYSKPTEEYLVEVKSFNTKNRELMYSSNIPQILEDMGGIINLKSEEFQERDSGWSLLQILYLEVNINKYNPLRGSTYIPLPLQIEKKHACINIKNNDNKCFLWACLSCLYQSNNHHSNQVNSYECYINEINFTGLDFPMKIRDIPKFERMNEDISVNVFGLEYDCKYRRYSVIGPYHHTEQVKNRHINLLFIENHSDGHYVWIKNLSRLVSSQLSQRQNQKFICNGCLLFFRTEQKLEEHTREDCIQLKTLLPEKGADIKFVHTERQLKIPFVIYADFESLLKPLSHFPNTISNIPSRSTVETHEHIPASFGYYIKSDLIHNLSKYVSYRGANCPKIFLQQLKEDVTKIYNNYLKIIVPIIPLTRDEQNQFNHSTICFICEKDILLTDVKVRNHCHITGKYRGSAHQSCNLSYKIPNFIPVFFHNMSGYDLHLFIKECGEYPDDHINVIPTNKENYISISVKIPIQISDEKTILFEIRFLDSFRFMPSSIDSLVSTMKPEQFVNLKSIFKEKFTLLARKGIYPYEYFDSWDKFNEQKIPPISAFYNKITDEHLTADEYEWVENIWNTFKINDLGEYSDLYLKTDVILLTDIFENFRTTTIKTYNLDPCHYYTSPGLSFDAMLKITKIQIEQLYDIEMINFIKKGIRGGISQCSNRYGRANNKYLPNYKPQENSSYLIYLDANNQYGWAMSQPLPYGGFAWLDEYQISNLNLDNLSTNPEVGYIFECDLTYPPELHDIHNDFPFCAENIIPPNGKIHKLIPNLNSKKKYVIHYENLKQCLKHGLKLAKIHRVLKFNQSPWLTKYIELNTQLRQKATNEFEKNQYKLYNNAVFGKTMENIEKRVNIKLINHWENNRKKLGASSLISKPNFHSRVIFTPNLIAVQLNKTKIFYNKPIYLGFCILELSKTLMYEFHYDYILPKYGSKAKLLYTDTDSFVYNIQTDDFYSDIKPDIYEWFDTSALPVENIFNLPIANKKVVGKMKDELEGGMMTEFVGLRSKLYALEFNGGCNNSESKCKKRAKGVNRSVIKKLKFGDFQKCLQDQDPVKRSMLRFKSIKHTLFTQQVHKISLSAMDEKRFLLGNSHDTLAWGHYRIVNNVHN